MLSPSAALRAVPTWTGPVGLALTNSTCTRPWLPTGSEPNVGALGQDRVDLLAQPVVGQREIEKARRGRPRTPARIGGRVLGDHAPRSPPAISIGFGPARADGALGAQREVVAKSPLSAFDGRSMVTSGSATVGQVARSSGRARRRRARAAPDDRGSAAWVTVVMGWWRRMSSEQCRPGAASRPDW